MSEDSGEEELYPDLRYKADYDISKIRGYLTPEQATLVDEFRGSLTGLIGRELTPLELHWADDACLCRYMRARDWKMKAAQKLIADSFEWRRTYRPFAITADDVRIEMENTGKLYRNGFDKYGRPVLYMKPGKDNTGSEVRELKVKYLVYLLEKCIQHAAINKREKWTLIVDHKNFSGLTGMAHLKTSMDTLHILLNHYPERLGQCFMVNAPYTYVVFWKCVQPFIDDVTKSKVHVVSSTKILLDYIHEDELEIDYGGKNDFKWDFETHFRREDDKFPPWSEEKFGDAVGAHKKKRHRKKKKKSAKQEEHHEEKSDEEADHEEAEEAKEAVEAPQEAAAATGQAKKRRKKKKKHAAQQQMADASES